MPFKAVSLILLALSLVRASHSPTGAPRTETTDIEVSEKFAIPCAIVSVDNNGTIFTFDTNANNTDLDVLLPMTFHTPNDMWNRWNDPKSDVWVFQNRGTGQWLTVNRENDYIITSPHGPTEFAVDHAGEGHVVIKLANEDKVLEAIYDGTSMLYGRIALRPANGDVHQRWKYTSGLD